MVELNESEKAKIELQAKKILEDFAKTLSKVKVTKSKKEKESLSGFREEKEGNKMNEDFKKIMFSNAPQTTGDNIIAESKEW